MLKVIGLTKYYKKVSSKKNNKKQKINAVDNINFEVENGEIFGLIGPNGAGKTTTLKILSTLIIPDSGTAFVEGYDILKNPENVKERIGFLSGEFSRLLYWRLSGRKNLKFFAKLNGIWNPEKRINDLIEIFNLNDFENEAVMKYSTGMKHKLALAIGLLKNPPVLFLDEPLTGIDPVTTYEIKKIVKNEFADKTIIWASHNLYEIEEMCKNIALINNGRIVLNGETEKLKREYWQYKKIIIYTDKPGVFKSISNAKIVEDYVEVQTDNLDKTIEEIMEIKHKKNIKIENILTKTPSLEDIFMEKIKKC